MKIYSSANVISSSSRNFHLLPLSKTEPTGPLPICLVFLAPSNYCANTSSLSDSKAKVTLCDLGLLPGSKIEIIGPLSIMSISPMYCVTVTDSSDSEE